ncbi:hypothetical protein BBJ28_00007948 [Nothophytophthora sp. Chile5]|nr:hypothetical protein BBJ28_00007948 [Nothophytophthora sp. Chile5]
MASALLLLRRSGRLLQAPSVPQAVTGPRGAFGTRAPLFGRRLFSSPAEGKGALSDKQVVSEKPRPRARRSTVHTRDVPSRTAWRSQVSPLLRTFKELEGHMLVPTNFEIPMYDTRWPESAWGYSLGIAVKRLRQIQRHSKIKLSDELVGALDALGFVWDVSDFKWTAIVMPALRRFHQIHGHTDVPRYFVVPKEDENWPESSRGARLGFIAMNMRVKKAFAKQAAASAEELKRLDFCLDGTIYDRDWNEKVLPSLEVYHREKGHCNVETSFLVPSTLPWPRKAWAMRLGIAVDDMKVRQAYTEQIARDKDRVLALGLRLRGQTYSEAGGKGRESSSPIKA